jgi:hypothetical protein
MSLLLKIVAAIAWLLALAGAYNVGAHTDRGGSTWDGLHSLQEAIRARDPIRRSFEVSRSLRGLDARHLPEAIRTVEDAHFWFDQQEYYLLMYAWVRIEPVSAIDWAFDRPRPLAHRAQIALVDALGFYDQPRAGSVLRSLGVSGEAEILHEHMVTGWARSDARASLTEYIENMQQGTARQRAIKVFIHEILKGGPDALIAWTESIPIDAARQFKRATFQKSVNLMAGVEPRRAADLLEEHLGEPYANKSHRVLTLSWLKSDPAAAMDWLATLEGERALPEVVKKSFASWVEIDPVPAEAWALGAPPTSTLDPARRVLVRKYFNQEPARAMDWAHRIDDRMTRLRVQASAGRAWWRADPDAFLAWLPDSGLDTQVRDLILNTAHNAAAPTESPGVDRRQP